MIFEGVKLAILGMGVVFIFLLLLIFFIYLSSKILRKYTEQEINASTIGSRSQGSLMQDKKLLNVIGAAISKYKNKK
jgi:sodium pump decarboxylase gamma subunit